MPFENIEPVDYKRLLDNGELEGTLTIDVREPVEWEYYHWEEMELMPMMTIPSKLDSLPREKSLYVVCAHGVRSMNVCYYLKQQGFDEVINIAGGMAALAALKGVQYD